MRTFTLRELSRSIARVLEACEEDGGVIIQHEDGRQFELVQREAPRKPGPGLPDFAARQRALFGRKRFTSRQVNAVLSAGKGQQRRRTVKAPRGAVRRK